MAQCWEDFTNSAVTALTSKKLLRSLHPIEATQNAVQVDIAGNVLNQWLQECGLQKSFQDDRSHALRLFSLNDYLGLSTHPKVCLAACRAACQYGLGPRSSPLIGGYSNLHSQLEIELAHLKETEDALLFPSGFAANQATIAVLGAGPDCVIYSDELNHASIIDGIRLAKASGASAHVYRHNDMEHLEKLLRAAPEGKRKLVVTDSLFSMDGDFADLHGLARLRQEHDFLLVIDEAHATLVCGPRGGGAADLFGVSEEVDVHVGTLSKAIGSQGGFVACKRSVKQLLQSRGRPFIFSTAQAAPSVAAALAAIKVAHEEPWRQKHLQVLMQRLSDGLGIKVESPIVPIIIGAESDALRAAGNLLNMGFHVPAIRPPTVKEGTCRLRVSLSAAHTTEDVDDLVAAIKASKCLIQQSAAATTRSLL